ncbi:tetratricopeptide (TPR) repeat protein [Nocardioides thalensis]|uniref:Tetratricopeptide (TPR) repeat protein n=1 Tax=Nocardioides thalensis TaxID=1914755 RepID=A0A853C5F4_9ACTN|nr:tetratricopeptide repeat protein [Nocardioides thalensis]NYJ02246.1 tetratricopeptide (TPR) repeat protein [Nocardioides thalensis]
MLKYLLVLGISLILAATGGIGIASRSTPEPAAAGPDVRINPGDGRDLKAVIAQLENGVERVPDDHVAWATLALAYVEQVRVAGDTSLYDRAQAAVERSFEIKPDDNVTALTARSALLAVAHDFTDALAAAEEALAIDPYHPAALVLRIDAIGELGRYGAQLAALRDADRRQPGVPVVARYAYAFELRGDLDRAARLLRQGARTAISGDRAHLLTLLADVERRRGNLDRTASLLADVRRLDPAYLPALISRARLAMAQQRFAAAARLWEKVVDRAAHPEHRVELLEIYTVLGREDLVEEQEAFLVDYASEMTSEELGRELDVALFMADHADPAVGLAAARSEWRARQGVPAADALGWALHRTGRSATALRYARLATRLGTPDALFWIHRGLIEAHLNKTTAARRHLRYALQLDAGISPLQRRAARHAIRRMR